MNEEYLLVIFASSSSCLNSSLAFCNLLFFSLYSSFILLFTNWSNTWTHTGNTDVIVTSWHCMKMLEMKVIFNLPNLFPLIWSQQQVSRVKYHLMKLLLPGGECRHLRRATGQYLNLMVQSVFILAGWLLINLIYMEVHYTYWLRSIMLYIQFF